MSFRNKNKSSRYKNTRNVRNPKPQNEKHEPDLAFLKPASPRFSGVTRIWTQLPTGHQNAIMVIFVLWLLVIFWPISEEAEPSTVREIEPIIIPIRHAESDLEMRARRDPMDDSYELQRQPRYPRDYSETPVPDVIHHQTRPEMFVSHDDQYEPKRARDYEALPHEAYRGSDAYRDDDRRRPHLDELPARKEVVAITLDEAEPVSRGQGLTDRHVHRVQAGESLTSIFKRYGLKLGDLYAISAIEGAGKPISRLNPGQTIELESNAQGRIESLIIENDAGSDVTFTRQANGKFIRLG